MVSDLAIAVDIGGTFTDIALVSGSGEVWVDKVLTTHDNLLTGFFAAVDAVLAKANYKASDVTAGLIHATTVVTNALLEHKGSKTALVTTKGFADVLHIRDAHRYDMFDAQIEFPLPLVPAALTFTLDERVLATGDIVREIDDEEVRVLARRLIEEEVSSVAVCLLHSYRNPENERRVGEILRSEAPGVNVSLSSEVAPLIREYLRTSTCVINAYTAPISQPYLRRLTSALKSNGFQHDAMMMLSSGGVIALPTAGQFPVRMIESGPAAGALASSYYARELDIPLLLSFDMGGTTAKACIIQNHEALVSRTFEVAHMYRFKKGSGYPVAVPSVDMIEIGAGGGSIASVDGMGLLKVGPRSAGSMPGPVCYGRGGSDVTVTDANLVLGFLDANNFLGGEMKLDATSSSARMDELGESLGVFRQAAAAGIYRVVGETMAAAARAHAVERGIDARGIPVLAFGGAGPLHACYLAELLGSSEVVFPLNASVLSAMGMLVSTERYDLVRGYLRKLSEVDWTRIEGLIEDMIENSRAIMGEAGLDAAAIRYAFAVDMRYSGQESEITVQLPNDPREIRDIDWLRTLFEDTYKSQYSITLETEPEIVSLRLTCRGPERKRELRFASGQDEAAPVGQRVVGLNAEAEGTIYAVYRRASLRVGQHVDGPALIEERETTAVILPGWAATIHSTGCIIATRNEHHGH
jgi:N-methylhydantoinase A